MCRWCDQDVLPQDVLLACNEPLAGFARNLCPLPDRVHVHPLMPPYLSPGFHAHKPPAACPFACLIADAAAATRVAAVACARAARPRPASDTPVGVARCCVHVVLVQYHCTCARANLSTCEEAGEGARSREREECACVFAQGKTEACMQHAGVAWLRPEGSRVREH